MARGICNFFGAGQNCRFGDKCKYKHEQPTTSGALSDRTGPEQLSSAGSSGTRGDAVGRSDANNPPEIADLLNRWRFCLPEDRRKNRPLGENELETFLTSTLKLVESSADNMQLVISKLGEERGLIRVRQIIDWDFDKMNDDKLDNYITTLLLPYFRVLSHKAVVQSMVVETQHTALLNALYGINGARGANVFAALVRGLSVRNNSEDVETAIAVLAAMLDRNRSGMANPILQAAAEFLVSLLDLSHRSRASERHVRTIKTVLQLAVDLPQTRLTAGHADPDATVATFTFAQDLPGALSEYGPRHDNDSDNIMDIEILPTLQEILRLLDRHFRLVREDTVGQLRDAVKAQLSHQQSTGENRTASNKSIRTNAYDDVSLSNVVFDAKQGLLFVLQFKQPQPLRGKSSKSREEWWQDSQRLGPESLICLLSSSEDAGEEATFLVVHSPDFLPFNSKSQKTGPPIHEQYTLSKDPEQAFVIAKLASTEPSAASDFLKSCLSPRKARRSLVEFPGVLLPTFGPTLSALQRIAASLDVPFAEALVPDAAAANPRPPAYSVRKGFQYNLRGLILEDQLEQYQITGDSKQDMVSALQLSSLDKSQRDIARIGSRSKSERLAGVNLRTLAQQRTLTKMEGKKWGELKGLIEKSDLLQDKYPTLHAQLPRDCDEDGFTVARNKKSASFLETWLKGVAPVGFTRYRSLAILRSGTVRLTDMSRKERESLHASWIEELTSSMYYSLMVELSTFNRSRATLESLRGDLDLRILSEANVVGITTTRLARQLDTLSQLPSKVLVVEEAGEVLEAYLLTAMLLSLEHAILIGDYQQLRPKVQNYDLSAENPRNNLIALDISLFERFLYPR
ncbi:hypothetical protein CBER1_00183 [Cercospora berteroae]|uniref:C3H1-type domain-containing protein n=1 Tax=Cercospora berteroae TaxID=357750 RepID=A0A2S6CDA4_9PEZI|nr:hypothetical protein CBER1_00183 [Cercospora berteroae]